MAVILAIDPGSARSAFVVYDAAVARLLELGREPNEWLVDRLRCNDSALTIGVDEAVIEWMQPRGMATSAQEFETLYWIGRFVEAAEYGARSDVPWPVARLSRLRVKTALCGSARANDANIRQALIDRFGGTGGKRAAVGLKASPGPLYGIANDMWAALAVAVTWAEGGATWT